MIDIVALFFLTRYMGNLAISKGEKSSKWKMFTILFWFGGGFVGSIVATALFGPMKGFDMMKPGNSRMLFQLMLLFYSGAVAGYHVARTILRNKPDIDTNMTSN